MWPGLRALWRRRALWRGSFLPLAMLALLLVFGGLGYAGVDHFNELRGTTLWSPRTIVDDQVPALPWTIVVYFTFHALFVVTAFCAPGDERGSVELVLLFQGLFAVGLFSLVVFLCAPCSVDLRSMEVLHSGAFAPAFRLLHASDPPWNAWPSLHVSQSLLCALAIARWRARTRPWLRPALAALWLAIALSTLTTKQHFVFDALTGAWLGWAAWSLRVRPAMERIGPA